MLLRLMYSRTLMAMCAPRGPGGPRAHAARRWCVRPYFQYRAQFGMYHTMVPVMMAQDPEKFFNYFRMTPRVFNELLAQVGPGLQRRPVVGYLCPGERLAMTLR